MAWTESAWQTSWFTAGVYSTGGDHSLDHQMRAALFDNTVTPDKSAASYTGYNSASGGAGVGPWIPSAEVTSPPGWPAGGVLVPASASAVPPGEDTVRLAGDPVLSSQAVTMVPGPHGDLVYDSEATRPIPSLGFAFHYFGGNVDITAGTFAIIWAAEGIAVLTAELLPAP